MLPRILLVSDVYAPYIGGAERQIQLIAKELLARGYEVAVATAWQVGLAEEEHDEELPIYRLKGLASLVPWFSVNPTRRHHPPLPDPGTVWRLRRLVRRFKPDVVHSYGWITYSCAGALFGTGIPLLVSIREYGHTCALRTLVRYDEQPCEGPALLKCLQCATRYYGIPKGVAAVAGVWSGIPVLRHQIAGLHTISTYTREIIWRDLYGGEDRYAASGRPMPVEKLIPSFRKSLEDEHILEPAAIKPYLELLPKEPFILFVGALRLIKGLKPLLAAYERLENPPPLVLMGPAAPDTPTVFPPGVLVLKEFPHPAVMEAWARCIFGVAPSLWPEPLGSVVYEAMSKGKAIIGTRPGGHTDMIIDGVTGFLVPPNDVKALAEAMQLLLDSPELRSRFGQAGRKRAQLFLAELIMPQFEELYQQTALRARKLVPLKQGARR